MKFDVGRRRHCPCAAAQGKQDSIKSIGLQLGEKCPRRLNYKMLQVGDTAIRTIFSFDSGKFQG